MKKPKISIAIPTHEMEDGVFFLKRSLDAIATQTFKDYEVIVTDNSDNNAVYNLCSGYPMHIGYTRNPRKGMAHNTNEAIRKSRGELIKILYMDDYLYDKDALLRIVEAFQGNWLVTGCAHSKDYGEPFNLHYPYYSSDIPAGNNTIGSPSVLTIKNDDPLFFDEELTWLLDCDYYRRLYDKYGEPTVMNDINVIIGLGEHQMTNIIPNERKQSEERYMKRKYETN